VGGFSCAATEWDEPGTFIFEWCCQRCGPRPPHGPAAGPAIRPQFYDLTSTYFEGRGPTEMGAHGHSRDGKPRNPQVLVGLVLVDGWPIAHHVFEGAQHLNAVAQRIDARKFNRVTSHW
jgi:hypothetical protein